MDRMTCATCYYHTPIYDEAGLIVASQCTADDLRETPIDIARVMHCGKWAEADE